MQWYVLNHTVNHMCLQARVCMHLAYLCIFSWWTLMETECANTHNFYTCRPCLCLSSGGRKKCSMQDKGVTMSWPHVAPKYLCFAKNQTQINPTVEWFLSQAGHCRTPVGQQKRGKWVSAGTISFRTMISNRYLQTNTVDININWKIFTDVSFIHIYIYVYVTCTYCVQSDDIVHDSDGKVSICPSALHPWSCNHVLHLGCCFGWGDAQLLARPVGNMHIFFAGIWQPSAAKKDSFLHLVKPGCSIPAWCFPTWRLGHAGSIMIHQYLSLSLSLSLSISLSF